MRRVRSPVEQQALWDKLPMHGQNALMDEWNSHNPERPGDNPRDRVAARLEWCLETLGQRSKAEAVP
jgi:hypothetical protein